MAQRATSLGPKPSFFVFFFLFFLCFSLFSFLCVWWKSPVSLLKKGIFVYFSVFSLCFSLASFWPPPFSIYLSLSLSCYLISPSFLFLTSVSGSCILFLFCLHFVSRCSLILFFCLFSRFVLNHTIRSVFALHLFFIVVVVFGLCCFGIFFWFLATYQKTSP